MVVNFSAGLASNSGIYAFIFERGEPDRHADLRQLKYGRQPSVRDITLANVPTGSVGITTGNYRLGVSGPITSTATSGTSIVTGAGGGGGNFWSTNDGTIIAHGGHSDKPRRGKHDLQFDGRRGVRHPLGVCRRRLRAPYRGTTAINLPATNFFLPTGTTLKIAGPGDSVIGAVTYAGNATVSPGAVAPASLTIGGTGGAGTGTLRPPIILA